MGGGGKGGDGGDSTVRYAPYIETAHQELLALSKAEEGRLLNLTTTPYDGLAFDDIDIAFFSAGYTITSFPSLWDMFGKFVAGLDIEVLYDQIYDNMVNGEVTNDVIAAQNVYLQDEIDTNALPRILAGLSDINCVMSSSFIDSKERLQTQKTKIINKFAADIKMGAMEQAMQRWSQHLQWNNHVIEQYRIMNQLFWATKFDHVNASQELSTREYLWKFTIMDHHKANIAALNGAAASTGSTKGASTAARAIAGAMGGAAMGAVIAGASKGAIGGPAGIAIGAALGLAASIL